MVNCDGIQELALLNYEGVSLDDVPPETTPENEQSHGKIIVNPWGEQPHETGIPIVQLNSAGRHNIRYVILNLTLTLCV